MAKAEKLPETDLAKRLTAIRKAIGFSSRNAQAKAMQLATSTLASYELGLSEPTASVIKKYNDYFGVNIVWIVTGSGDMFGSADSPHGGRAILDRESMKTAIEAVEKGLNEHPFSLSRKAELVLACYDLIVADQSEENMDRVIKLLKAVA